MPKCVELVYWDYYSQTQEFYESMIEKHLAFDNPVSLAEDMYFKAHAYNTGKGAMMTDFYNGVIDAFNSHSSWSSVWTVADNGDIMFGDMVIIEAPAA